MLHRRRIHRRQNALQCVAQLRDPRFSPDLVGHAEEEKIDLAAPDHAGAVVLILLKAIPDVGRGVGIVGHQRTQPRYEQPDRVRPEHRLDLLRTPSSGVKIGIEEQLGSRVGIDHAESVCPLDPARAPGM